MNGELALLLLRASEIDAELVAAEGPVEAFKLGCELGAISALLVFARRQGGPVDVVVSRRNGSRAVYVASELGAQDATAKPIRPGAPYRLRVRF